MDRKWNRSVKSTIWKCQDSVRQLLQSKKFDCYVSRRNSQTIIIKLGYSFIFYVLLVDAVSANGGMGKNSWNNSVSDINTLDKSLDSHDTIASASATLSLLPKTSSGCPPSASKLCLRCNIEGCIKCPAFLVIDSRMCVNHCPSGYSDNWSSFPDIMGRVCTSNGLSKPLLATIAGMLGGFFVCFLLLVLTIYLFKSKRRRKFLMQKLINETPLERSEFLLQLNELRPNAEHFLAILNNTRRQVRKLYLSGEASAANAYRPIIRDLAKILILLNRPIEHIHKVPPDWNQLYSSSKQALECYKTQVGHQLIDFFQSSKHENSKLVTSFELADFKHTSKGLLNESKKYGPFGSLISLHEFDEPRPLDPFGSSFDMMKGNFLTEISSSSLWLEEEFFKLGFRPQDEVTTEL